MRIGLSLRARALTALVLAASALLAGACGDDGDPADATGGAQGVGQLKAGSSAALAQCRDWNAGTEEQRLATIADIRGRSSEPARISDEQAYELFESACSRGYTAGFRLYKIYDRAAAFQPIAPE